MQDNNCIIIFNNIILRYLRPRRRDPLPHARARPRAEPPTLPRSCRGGPGNVSGSSLRCSAGMLGVDFQTRTRPRTRRLSPLRRSLFLGTRFYVFFFAKPREISLVLPLIVAHICCVCLQQPGSIPTVDTRVTRV